METCPDSDDSKRRLSKLIADMLDDDDVYYYSSIEDDWKKGEGSEGFVVVRDEAIVGSYVQRMN